MQRFYAPVEKVYARFFMAKPYSFSTKRIGGNSCVQFVLPGGGRTYQKSTGTTNRKDAEKIAKGYFDVDFRCLETDRYILYVVIQIPVIIIISNSAIRIPHVTYILFICRHKISSDRDTK